MSTLSDIKEAILNLSEVEHSELIDWFCGSEDGKPVLQSEATTTMNSDSALLIQKAQRLLETLTEDVPVTPFQQWRLFPERVAGRWRDELNHLEGFTHFCSSIGRIYADLALNDLAAAPHKRVTNPKERARNLIIALVDLHMKTCSLAGATVAALRYGYPNAGWGLCRIMLENLILARFLVKYNGQDAAERYNGSVAIQFAEDDQPVEAKELYQEYASYFPDAKRNGWASGIDGKVRWNTREMAVATESENLYVAIFKSESKYVHPDASGLWGDVDDEFTPPIHQALIEPYPSRLYGQTDGASIVLVAYEVTQYLTATTFTLLNAWPIEKSETLLSNLESRSKPLWDLLEQSCQESQFIKKMTGGHEA